MLSRLLWGGRTTLVVATAAVHHRLRARRRCSASSAATSAGKVDAVVSLLLDVFLAIPAVILALALVTILRTQPGTEAAAGLDPEVALILALGHRVDPGARPHHAREHAVVVGARVRARGAGAGREAPAHHRSARCCRTCCPAMFSIALLGIAVAIVAEGTLAHPRRERRDRHADLGQHDRDRAQLHLQRAPHIVFEPALMIFFTVLALNMLGDVVRSRFDVREGGL